MKFLVKWYNIISFKELSNNIIRWNSLIITFDDGYEDNYKDAYSILRRNSVKATFFVTVNKIKDRDSKPFWWDRAYYYLQEMKSSQKDINISEIDKEVCSILHLYQSNYSKLFEKLNEIETQKIERLLDEIKNRYNISEGGFQNENSMLTWQEISEMKGDIEFGSHTCNHSNLSQLSEEERYLQIYESKKIIERQIKEEVIAFSYPGGSKSKELEEIVKKVGYRFAATTESGVNNLRNPYALKRINVWEETCLPRNGKISKGYFAYRLMGL
jgi:peptidoglycan/xylan/chitin deacetylase (PgdA/CDA1 family)